jgi:hypothetical protein
VIIVGICPRCGSWVDEGEPYCPECCYDGSDGARMGNYGMITINGEDYDIDCVEEVLDRLGYDLDDLRLGLIDEDELEELLEDSC